MNARLVHLKRVVNYTSCCQATMGLGLGVLGSALSPLDPGLKMGSFISGNVSFLGRISTLLDQLQVFIEPSSY